MPCAIEAIEATLLPASAPAPCTRASAGRRSLRCDLLAYGLEVVLFELGLVSGTLHWDRLFRLHDIFT